LVVKLSWFSACALLLSVSLLAAFLCLGFLCSVVFALFDFFVGEHPTPLLHSSRDISTHADNHALFGSVMSNVRSLTVAYDRVHASCMESNELLSDAETMLGNLHEEESASRVAYDDLCASFDVYERVVSSLYDGYLLQCDRSNSLKAVLAEAGLLSSRLSADLDGLCLQSQSLWERIDDDMSDLEKNKEIAFDEHGLCEAATREQEEVVMALKKDTHRKCSKQNNLMHIVPTINSWFRDIQKTVK
jgi:hypothetical protein